MPGRQGNKWKARRKRLYEEHYLGLFSTREEAARVEAEFDKTWPSLRGRYDRTLTFRRSPRAPQSHL